MPILSLYASGGSIFNPGTLDLTGWWRPNYAGQPWVGTASTGISGNQDLSAAGAAEPSIAVGIIGPSLQYNLADFDGAADEMTAEGLASDYFTTTNFSGWCLANIESIATNDTGANKGNNICLWSSNGTLQEYVYLRNNGASTDQVGYYVGVPGDRFVETDFVINTWQLVQFRGNGTVIEIRVNDHAWQSATGGTNATLNHIIRVGNSPFLDDFLDGRLAELAFSKQFFSDATFNNVLSYCRIRYNLALT